MEIKVNIDVKPERIVNQNLGDDGILYFKVKWVDNWLSLQQVLEIGAKHLVNQFHATLGLGLNAKTPDTTPVVYSQDYCRLSCSHGGMCNGEVNHVNISASTCSYSRDNTNYDTIPRIALSPVTKQSISYSRHEVRSASNTGDVIINNVSEVPTPLTTINEDDILNTSSNQPSVIVSPAAKKSSKDSASTQCANKSTSSVCNTYTSKASSTNMPQRKIAGTKASKTKSSSPLPSTPTSNTSTIMKHSESKTYEASISQTLISSLPNTSGRRQTSSTKSNRRNVKSPIRSPTIVKKHDAANSEDYVSETVISSLCNTPGKKPELIRKMSAAVISSATKLSFGSDKSLGTDNRPGIYPAHIGTCVTAPSSGLPVGNIYGTSSMSFEKTSITSCDYAISNKVTQDYQSPPNEESGRKVRYTPFINGDVSVLSCLSRKANTVSTALPFCNVTAVKPKTTNPYNMHCSSCNITFNHMKKYHFHKQTCRKGLLSPKRKKCQSAMSKLVEDFSITASDGSSDELITTTIDSVCNSNPTSLDNCSYVSVAQICSGSAQTSPSDPETSVSGFEGLFGGDSNETPKHKSGELGDTTYSTNNEVLDTILSKINISLKSLSELSSSKKKSPEKSNMEQSRQINPITPLTLGRPTLGDKTECRENMYFDTALSSVCDTMLITSPTVDRPSCREQLVYIKDLADLADIAAKSSKVSHETIERAETLTDTFSGGKDDTDASLDSNVSLSTGNLNTNAVKYTVEDTNIMVNCTHISNINRNDEGIGLQVSPIEEQLLYRKDLADLAEIAVRSSKICHEDIKKTEVLTCTFSGEKDDADVAMRNSSTFSNDVGGEASLDSNILLEGDLDTNAEKCTMEDTNIMVNCTRMPNNNSSEEGIGFEVPPIDSKGALDGVSSCNLYDKPDDIEDTKIYPSNLSEPAKDTSNNIVEEEGLESSSVLAVIEDLLEGTKSCNKEDELDDNIRTETISDTSIASSESDKSCNDTCEGLTWKSRSTSDAQVQNLSTDINGNLVNKIHYDALSGGQDDAHIRLNDTSGSRNNEEDKLDSSSTSTVGYEESLEEMQGLIEEIDDHEMNEGALSIDQCKTGATPNIASCVGDLSEVVHCEAATNKLPTHPEQNEGDIFLLQEEHLNISIKIESDCNSPPPSSISSTPDPVRKLHTQSNTPTPDDNQGTQSYTRPRKSPRKSHPSKILKSIDSALGTGTDSATRKLRKPGRHSNTQICSDGIDENKSCVDKLASDKIIDVPVTNENLSTFEHNITVKLDSSPEPSNANANVPIVQSEIILKYDESPASTIVNDSSLKEMGSVNYDDNEDLKTEERSVFDISYLTGSSLSKRNSNEILQDQEHEELSCEVKNDAGLSVDLSTSNNVTRECSTAPYTISFERRHTRSRLQSGKASESFSCTTTRKFFSTNSREYANSFNEVDVSSSNVHVTSENALEATIPGEISRNTQGSLSVSTGTRACTRVNKNTSTGTDINRTTITSTNTSFRLPYEIITATDTSVSVPYRRTRRGNILADSDEYLSRLCSLIDKRCVKKPASENPNVQEFDDSLSSLRSDEKGNAGTQMKNTNNQAKHSSTERFDGVPLEAGAARKIKSEGTVSSQEKQITKLDNYISPRTEAMGNLGKRKLSNANGQSEGTVATTVKKIVEESEICNKKKATIVNDMAVAGPSRSKPLGIMNDSYTDISDRNILKSKRSSPLKYYVPFFYPSYLRTYLKKAGGTHPGKTDPPRLTGPVSSHLKKSSVSHSRKRKKPQSLNYKSDRVASNGKNAPQLKVTHTDETSSKESMESTRKKDGRPRAKKTKCTRSNGTGIRASLSADDNESDMNETVAPCRTTSSNSHLTKDVVAHNKKSKKRKLREFDNTIPSNTETSRTKEVRKNETCLHQMTTSSLVIEKDNLPSENDHSRTSKTDLFNLTECSNVPFQESNSSRYRKAKICCSQVMGHSTRTQKSQKGGAGGSHLITTAFTELMNYSATHEANVQISFEDVLCSTKMSNDKCVESETFIRRSIIKRCRVRALSTSAEIFQMASRKSKR